MPSAWLTANANLCPPTPSCTFDVAARSQVLTCRGAEEEHGLCSGSPGSANLQLDPQRARAPCGFAVDRCASRRGFCCTRRTLAPQYDVVVIGSGLAGSATAAALAQMLSNRGLREATVALLDASPDPVQGSGSTSAHAEGMAWFPNAKHPSQAGCGDLLSGQADWVKYIEARAGDAHSALVKAYVAASPEVVRFWDAALGGVEVLPVHQWSHRGPQHPAYDPAAIPRRSATGAACWPDYAAQHNDDDNSGGNQSREPRATPETPSLGAANATARLQETATSTTTTTTYTLPLNVAGNVFQRAAKGGNWQRRRAADWLGDLASLRTRAGSKRRHSLWTGHTVLNVTAKGTGTGYTLAVKARGTAKGACMDLEVQASRVVFASGGYGAKVYPQHHASVDTNTGLARDVAVRAWQWRERSAKPVPIVCTHACMRAGRCGARCLIPRVRAIARTPCGLGTHVPVRVCRARRARAVHACVQPRPSCQGGSMR